MMVTTASGGAPTAGATQHIKLMMQARAERSEGGVCEQHWSLFGGC